MSSTRRTGFKVGPDNLPNGVHKRKVQAIKRKLIERAKVKRQFYKSQEDAEPQPSTIPSQFPEPSTERDGDTKAAAPHPDRQRLMEGPRLPHQNKPKQKAPLLPSRSDGEREKRKKLEDRARAQRTMLKARGGVRKSKTAPRKKLGLESTLLLDRAKKVMSKG